MRLRRSKRSRTRTGTGDAIDAAVTAAAEAQLRLATAGDVRRAAEQKAADEKETVVATIRSLRERNHLAEIIAESLAGNRSGGKDN